MFERPVKKNNYAMIVVPYRCINCGSCYVACKATWDVPFGKEKFRTKVLEKEWGQSGDNYDDLHMDFISILCFHCDNPACVSVCPTCASYKRKEDGIVVLDDKKCIGCRMCMLACPYNARWYNEEKGIVDKCNFCLDRLEEKKEPMCSAVCPTDCRVFGDLNDRNSDAFNLLAKAKRTWTLRPEMGTEPNVFYVEL